MVINSYNDCRGARWSHEAGGKPKLRHSQTRPEVCYQRPAKLDVREDSEHVFHDGMSKWGKQEALWRGRPGVGWCWGRQHLQDQGLAGQWHGSHLITRVFSLLFPLYALQDIPTSVLDIIVLKRYVTYFIHSLIWHWKLDSSLYLCPCGIDYSPNLLNHGWSPTCLRVETHSCLQLM